MTQKYSDYITDTCQWAIGQGIAKNRKEFARIVGVNYCSLTAVINGTGRNSGRYMFREIRLWRENKERELRESKEIAACYTDVKMAEYRIAAAKDFACAMLHGCADSYPDPEEVCSMAVVYADELIKQLREDEK